MTTTIGVREPDQSLADTLRTALLHSAQTDRVIAALYRTQGLEAEAEQYDSRAREDERRAAQHARIPALRIAS